MFLNNYLNLFVFVSLCAFVYCDLSIPKPTLNTKPQRQLGQCQACKLYIESLNKGLERTARGKFEGGDAAWEEEKLSSYSKSEVRLVEIQENLCSDIKDFSEQCHTIAEAAEPHLENWWPDQKPDDDIFKLLCIDSLEYCCPAGHYGKFCNECTGGEDNVCNGNGKCKGDGTRKGNGQCVCDDGYTGTACTDCSEGFYESYRDANKVICSACHKACEGGCFQGGVKGCSVCSPGWVMDTEKGCLDVNECLEKSPCTKNQFCVNTEGSFQCLECDKSCDGCTGDGPDMCDECAKGYLLKEDHCVNTESIDNARHVTYTRYITYFGLCITVCIIFQKSTILAGLLGIAIAMYITISEYMLSGDTAGSNPMIDPNSVDWASIFEKIV